MVPQPVMLGTTNNISTPAKRTLFRIALAIAFTGIIAVSIILILQGGLAFGRLRYFTDIGVHPLHTTSALLLFFGLLSLLSFIILAVGLVKANKTLAVQAAGIVGACSLGLIAFSIWSFLTITTTGQLPSSINSALVKELDQTQYSVSTGNNLVVENTHKMARLEKQHHCCGLKDPIEDYRSRIPQMYASLNPSSSSSGGGGSGSGRGRTSSTQRSTATFGSNIPLPISCCHEKYRSPDNRCIDIFGNNTNPINRYYDQGCYPVIARYKFERIQRQGFTTIVAACLAVISCVALAAIIRLLGEGYQIVPLRAAS